MKVLMDYESRRDAGVSPLFSPKHLDPETAAAEVQGIIQRSPYLFGRKTSRWRLQDVKEVVPWLEQRSLSGICRLLKRLEVRYKRGRVALHSPDLGYEKKMAAIRTVEKACREQPGTVVVLYEDEHTFGRYPTVAQAYAIQGKGEQSAKQYAGYNCLRRIAGFLDITSGAFITRQRNHFTAEQIAKLYHMIEETYPQAEVIYIILDNWKVHFEPWILKEMEERKSRIRLLRLPTYAPWTNPVEKVWRLFKQQVTHMHPYTYQWALLRDTIDAWFEERREGSLDLLRTVGILPPEKHETSPLHNSS
jgi:DDE superfamily endonuclease